MTNILKEMLLIEDPSIFRLYREMMDIAGYFITPVFLIALLLEYFGEMNFGRVVIKLLLITVFMGSFYEFHTKAVELSLDSASYTLKKVSPRNLFVKKWNYTKVRTKEKKEWNFIQSFAIPNLNDLLATAFFLLSKVFIWLLKLIYSTVYHLTYVFSGVTAILYFLGWTKDALKGTVQSSLWCMAMPFVIVAILALVGNSIDETALSGDLLIAKVDTIIWLFGVTLLLLISPLIAFGMIKGDGIHSFGSKMGSMVVSSGMKSMALFPFLSRMSERFSKQSVFGNRLKQNQNNNFDKNYQSKSDSKQSHTKEKGTDQVHRDSKESNVSKNQMNSTKQTSNGNTTLQKNMPHAPQAQVISKVAEKTKANVVSGINTSKATTQKQTVAQSHPIENRQSQTTKEIKRDANKPNVMPSKPLQAGVPTKKETLTRREPLRARRNENGIQ